MELKIGNEVIGKITPHECKVKEHAEVIIRTLEIETDDISSGDFDQIEFNGVVFEKRGY